MRVLLGLVLLFFGAGALPALAARDGKDLPVASESEKGWVAIGFFGGYNQFRTLNNDSTWAGYVGVSYGLGLDVRVYQFDSGGSLALFGNSIWTDSKNNDGARDTLKEQDLIVGAKVYVSPNFFVGAGAGNSMNDISTSSVNATLNSQATFIGLGMDFSIGQAWSMGLQGWYKTGLLKKDGNSSLSQNSAIEGFNTSVVFIWSPPATVINYYKK